MDDAVGGEKKAFDENLEALVAARTEQLRNAISALEKSYDTTLDALGKALALRDPETGRHSKRVAAFSIAIARAMGMSGDQIRIVARGGFLHDIGKLAVPENVLRKTSVLDEREITIMRLHCYDGYQLTKGIPFLAEPSEIVYAHHESFDGDGYPRGLKGQAIPVGARIVAVANVFDRLTAPHPYSAARSFDQAREEIQRCRGLQFDPHVAEVFLSMPEQTWADLRKGVAV
jgi:putative nucleotidyltransferase with HDIG domain